MAGGNHVIGRRGRRLTLLAVVLTLLAARAVPAQEAINAFQAKTFDTRTGIERELTELSAQLHRELDGQEFDLGPGVKKIEPKTIDEWFKRPSDEIKAALKAQEARGRPILMTKNSRPRKEQCTPANA